MEYNSSRNVSKHLDDFEYKSKIRSSIISAILFMILSNKVSYKILYIITSSISQSISVIDDEENPLFLGTIIMAVVIAIIVFVM